MYLNARPIDRVYCLHYLLVHFFRALIKHVHTFRMEKIIPSRKVKTRKIWYESILV
jgi:hypothetical protein